MEFSRKQYWSGLPLPSPGDLPNPGIECGCLALQADSLLSEPLGKPQCTSMVTTINTVLSGQCPGRQKPPPPWVLFTPTVKQTQLLQRPHYRLPNSSHRAACLGQVCITMRSCCVSYYKVLSKGCLLTHGKDIRKGGWPRCQSTKNLNSLLLMGTPKPQPSAEQQLMKKIGTYQKRSSITKTKDINKEPQRDGRRGRLAI